MQIILFIIGAVFLVFGILPVFYQVFNSGCAANLGAGALFVILGIRWHTLSFTQSKYIAFALLVLMIIYGASFETIMRAGRSRDDGRQVLVVLGCRIKGDIPSLALEKRIDTAFAYLVSHPDSVAILSGGQGRDEKLSEALCMYQHLTDRGIDKSRLYIEDKSVNTDSNIRYSLNIIEEHGFSRDIAVVTSEYHQLRAGIICERYGLTASPFSSKTLGAILPVFVNREMLAIVKEKFFPNIRIKM